MLIRPGRGGEWHRLSVQYRYLLLVGRWQKRMEMGRTTPPNIFSYHPQEAKNVK